MDAIADVALKDKLAGCVARFADRREDCELVSEVGFRRVANKARFQGVYG